LSKDISQNDLYQEFGCCGKIINVHIIRKPYYRHHTRKVFAFIKYESEGGATEAIDQKVRLDISLFSSV
jgi:RNA recognition motif-containing protein